MAPTVQRTVLITGCSDNSLGSHLSLAFHDAGWRVFATARNTTKLSKAREAGIETLQLDTLSEESIRNCASEVEILTNGSLDMLLNNAGGGYSMPIIDLDLDQTRALFDLNTFSLISMTRAFLPLLRKSTTTRGGMKGGIIVNNTSCSSLAPAAVPFGGGAYNASKAAATSITENLRLELESFGIKVVNLMTGAVISTFHANAPHPGLPSDSIYSVAKEVVEETMSGKAASVDGTDPAKWAKSVVKKLSKRDPSHWVWDGKYSTTTWLANFLPIRTLDKAVMKPMARLDVVEKKVRQQTEASGNMRA